MIIDGINFDEYEVESVKLDLKTCKLELEVIYHKDKRKVVRRKIYTIQTDCNVDINKAIENLKLDE